MSSPLRAVAYFARDFLPLQAFRALFDRDLRARMDMAAFAHDAAEGLAEREAEEEVWEPPHVCGMGDDYWQGAPGDVRICLTCGTHWRAEDAGPLDIRWVRITSCPGWQGPESDHAEALRLNEYADSVGGTIPPQHTSSVTTETSADAAPVGSTTAGSSGEAVSVPPSTPASPHPELAELIAEVLSEAASSASGDGDWCICSTRQDWEKWFEHVAPLIAERIEKFIEASEDQAWLRGWNRGWASAEEAFGQRTPLRKRTNK